MAISEEDMRVIMEQVNECAIKYGLKVNENKSKVVCINGEVGRRRWKMENDYIDEVVHIHRSDCERRKKCGFMSMGNKMKEANRLIGMIKYAAEQSGSRYVIGMEGRKAMIVRKLMYGCGALAWYHRECDDLEVIQMDLAYDYGK